MGQHRGGGAVRGVSKGPVIAVAAVIVLVLAVIGWIQLRDRISDQGTQAAQTCVEGDAELTVTADPDIAPMVRDLADRYAGTGPVVRDHCIRVTVTEEPSSVTADAVAAAVASGQWTSQTPAPALWIPQSSWSLSALEAHPGLVEGQPRSVASAAVVVAAPTVVAQAMTRPLVGWQDLPRLQSEPEVFTEAGLPNWGTLKMALPTTPGSDPTMLAAGAVAAAVAGAGAGPVTAEQMSTPEVATALATFARGAASITDPPATITDALTSLGAQANPRQGTFHAVPATEQQLAAAIAAGADLREVVPSGATPVADHPGTVLAASWTDETLRRAAAEFVDYLRQPEQADTFVGAGFRVEGRTPAATPAVAYAPIATPLLPPSQEVGTDLLDTVAKQAGPGRTTVLLDISGSMGNVEGSDTRLANTVAALTAAVDAAGDDAEVGLWVYSRGLDGSRPYQELVSTGPLGGEVDGTPRREAIRDALDALSPKSATSTYASVQAAYTSAVRGLDGDRSNSVLLITDGPNDDTSISSSQFLRTIASTGDGTHEVNVNVVAVGENSDATTLQELAEQTGGTMVTVSDSSGTALQQALAPLLG